MHVHAFAGVHAKSALRRNVSAVAGCADFARLRRTRVGKQGVVVGKSQFFHGVVRQIVVAPHFAGGLDIDDKHCRRAVQFFFDGYRSLTGGNCLDYAALNLQHVFVGRTPRKVFEVGAVKGILTDVFGLVGAIKVFGYVDGFACIHAEQNLVRAVRLTVGRKLEFAACTGKSAQIDVAVKRVVVNDKRKRVVDECVGIQIVEIIGNFDTYRCAGVAFAVNGNRVFRQVGVTAAGRENHWRNAHCVVIVVDCKVDVVTVFVCRLVVHLFVGGFLDYGSLVVHVEVETETVAYVCSQTVVAVIQETLHPETVLTVVDKSRFE